MSSEEELREELERLKNRLEQEKNTTDFFTSSELVATCKGWKIVNSRQ